MCEHVIVLNQGKIAFSDNMNSLLADETHWLIRANWPGMPDLGTDVSIEHNSDGSLRIRGQSEALRDQIIQQLLQQPSAHLIAVEPERRTLEQAFIKLLRGNNS
jgi:ABC-type multidrug transport system ATPase subunit